MTNIQTELLSQLNNLNEQQLRRLLVEHLTKQKLGLYWEANAIKRDQALNANLVLPHLVPEWSHLDEQQSPTRNLIIEGDNYDSLRLLQATHRGRIRVIYIDPPYNTGNQDWVYNDNYVGKNDRWRHSQWLEFLYRRLTLARDLLTPDGVILVSINDENRARLELLMDEVFPGRRLGSLAWRTKDTGNDLGQRFSHVHEHVLVYANPQFRFNGRATDQAKFRNPDNDPRGNWAPRPMSTNKTLYERQNTYYPIQDPSTGYWYPCDPDGVWRFASESIIGAGQKLRSETIEELIRLRYIYFPPCKPEDVLLFDSYENLIAAIREGRGPISPKKKTPLLREGLPNLEWWVGKPIATGRPSRKDFWDSKPEAERVAPLGSWIAGINETVEFDVEDEDAAPEILRSTRGGIATEEVKEVLGSKVFQHPKPLLLIKNLLMQATRPDDTVLDFFAGSGTTGQAVLELNAEGGGNRSFILCSSTEANDKQPDKNLCREVCAERMRRVMQGYADKPGLGGHFAYLQTNLIERADVNFEVQPEQAFQLLSLREAHTAAVASNDDIQRIASNGDLDVLLCTKVTKAAIKQLRQWPANTLAVYSPRPDTVEQQLENCGKTINSYSLLDALLRGQTGLRNR